MVVCGSEDSPVDEAVHLIEGAAGARPCHARVPKSVSVVMAMGLSTLAVHIAEATVCFVDIAVRIEIVAAIKHLDYVMDLQRLYGIHGPRFIHKRQIGIDPRCIFP